MVGVSDMLEDGTFSDSFLSRVFVSTARDNLGVLGTDGDWEKLDSF